MGNSICTTSNVTFNNDAQATIDRFSLLNLDNLSAPLQFLAKVRYFLSVVPAPSRLAGSGPGHTGLAADSR